MTVYMALIATSRIPTKPRRTFPVLNEANYIGPRLSSNVRMRCPKDSVDSDFASGAVELGFDGQVHAMFKVDIGVPIPETYASLA